MTLEQKRQALEDCIRQLGRVLVAYSGGVDSAFLAHAVHRVLAEDMLAVIADSPSLSRAHLRDAISFAEEQKIPLKIIHTQELEKKEYVDNDASRCFHCKDELFQVMSIERQQLGFDSIVYGLNTDDHADFRPGQQAAKLHGVIAPLWQAQLSKEEIRQLARQAGLRVWNKPASACLSSRIEYGRPLTRDALAVVEEGEDALRSLAFTQFRVRHHGDIVRIEIARNEMERALSPQMTAEFVRIFKALGFKYVTVDLEGYRSGSMNAVLPLRSLVSR